jgi:hypothetical protein
MPRMPPPSARFSGAGEAGSAQLTEREDPQRHARSRHRDCDKMLPVVNMVEKKLTMD